MRVFAISDVHLSLGVENKSMDVFGTGWARHIQRLQEGWRDTVAPGDLVLLAGDISWAMCRQDAREDLFFLHTLPGTKVLLRGNHDFWWSGYSKVLSMLPPSLKAVQNNALRLGDICICGTRGWTAPGTAGFSEEEDRKLFEREKVRLRLSLEQLPKAGTLNLCMLHYPPFAEKGEPTDMVHILEEYPVQHVVYGHLHGKSGRSAFQGLYGETEYHFTSADALHFVPKRIL